MALDGEDAGRRGGGPVLVVGAGICGLAVALALARRGRCVRVLEARLDPRTEAGRRAEAEAARLLDRAGTALACGEGGAAARHLEAADRLRASVWSGRNRNLLLDRHSLEFLSSLGVRIDGLPRLRVLDTHFGVGEPEILIRYGERRFERGAGRLDAATLIAQRDPVVVARIADVERRLRDAAEAAAGVEIFYGAQAVACAETADGVRVGLGPGPRRTMTGDVLVVADGAGRRSLSRRLGAERVRRGGEQMNIAVFECGGDTEVLGHSLREAWLDARATQGGWAVFLNTGDGLLTVNTRRVVGTRGPTALEIAADAGVGGRLLETPADFRYPLDRAARVVLGARTLVVGDAACRASPAWAFGAQFALLWAQMTADLCGGAGLDAAALEAFTLEAERVARMRLAYERSVLRLVDFANPSVRRAADAALAENLLAAVDTLEFDFRRTRLDGGRLALRFGLELERLLGASAGTDLAAFCRAVGRFDVDGALGLCFEADGRGSGSPTREAPFRYRTRLERIRARGGTFSLEHRAEGHWCLAMGDVELERRLHASRTSATVTIERAELRLPDAFVTAVIERAVPRLWALGATWRRPLCLELELAPGPLELGAFAMVLRDGPIARVTLSCTGRASRVAFELLRGSARVVGFSGFVRRMPLEAAGPLRLWQALAGRLADPWIDLWAAAASPLVRRVDFEIVEGGAGSAIYHVAGVSLRVPLGIEDFQRLAGRLLDSASCARLVRQYQRDVTRARLVPSASSASAGP